MYLNRFEYYAPKASVEALELVKRLGSRAKVLAGGTDLLNMMKERLIKPECLVDINNIEEYKGIYYEPGKGAVIGATTKVSEVEHSAIIREKVLCPLPGCRGTGLCTGKEHGHYWWEQLSCLAGS